MACCVPLFEWYGGCPSTGHNWELVARVSCFVAYNAIKSRYAAHFLLHRVLCKVSSALYRATLRPVTIGILAAP